MCKTLKDLVISQSQSDSLDIRDCYVQTGIEQILIEMDQQLVGLGDVKSKIREVCSVLLFDRIRELQELSTLNSSLHMSFTGASGTGKTSVAESVALVLRNLGLEIGSLFCKTKIPYRNLYFIFIFQHFLFILKNFIYKNIIISPSTSY